ncbi:MAG: CD225/dispanin family protein [Chitinophagaceae bacterium]|nr:CD225/dispanin family protein [Chitinophagaceae bacterium]
MFKKFRSPHTVTSRPKDWLIEAIVVTLIFFVPFGIVAIVYGVKTNTRYEAGEYYRSHVASYRAGLWSKLGVVAGIIFYVVYFILIN